MLDKIFAYLNFFHNRIGMHSRKNMIPIGRMSFDGNKEEMQAAEKKEIPTTNKGRRRANHFPLLFDFFLDIKVSKIITAARESKAFFRFFPLVSVKFNTLFA